ncbi:curli production assembly/transport protein CsgE [Noviherbaspirillum aridicola]|uniref:Curli production assembly/transport component CsgE n=1 Tax=Noviherbaspirillum aridicola TaxID=2849687 RepID=A0ABQ4Q704_9BURK|nr:curli production assembly/transport protein CsgE [Noviherbaspirillum aridicola]GIZ52988.1 hypothetical protein NCCP691_30020 [Noviherbaspirillum aridicola]
MNRRFLAVLALLALLALLPWARAQAAGDTLGALVVNQTVTVAGQEFFQHFVAAWRERELAERYSLSIIERPTARHGSQVWVEYAQRRMLQLQLPAARSGLQALGERAAEAVFQRVADAEVERLLFRDLDLAPDEI